MSLGVIYLAVLLSTGYLWTQLHYPSKFKLSKSSGWEYYFHCLFWGILFFLFTLPIYLTLDVIGVDGWLLSVFELSKQDAAQWPISTNGLKLLAWSVSSLVLALISGFVAWLYYGIPSNRDPKTKELVKSDPIESILYESIQRYKENPDDSFLAINLKSRKVYIGICDEIPLEHGEIRGIAITPAMSGYRDKDTLDLVLTINYFKHYPANSDTPELDIKDFKIVIFRDEIDSISYFNPDAYAAFQQSQIIT